MSKKNSRVPALSIQNRIKLVGLDVIENSTIKELMQVSGLSRSAAANLKRKAGVPSFYQKRCAAINKDGKRFCVGCSEWKLLQGNYQANSKSADGYRTICNKCRQNKRRILQLKTRYGFTTKEATEIATRCAANPCEICQRMITSNTNNGKKDEHLYIDHDHATGKFRGLLCNTCNTGIGLLKDDPNILIRAVDYLKKSLKN